MYKMLFVNLWSLEFYHTLSFDKEDITLGCSSNCLRRLFDNTKYIFGHGSGCACSTTI